MKRDYENALKQIIGVTQDETDLIANLSNISAILKEFRGYFWVGFYLVKNDELVIGPFQGSVACSRIAKGKGVCGTAWAEARTIRVENVHDFPGHIACSPFSKSEIVVPVLNEKGEVCMVLDVDSKEVADFDRTDEIGLEKIAAQITKLITEN